MKMSSPPISNCRNCQYYSPEGRRGGYCQKLNVAVKSRWDACHLALPPFASTWQELESLAVWQQKLMQQEEIFVNSVAAVVSSDLFEHASESAPSTYAKSKSTCS